MPGYHLTEAQVELIQDSLKQRYSFERMAYYKLLCSALNLPPEGFDISNDYFVDSGIFIIKKVEALNEHERLKDIWLAKSRLWEAEHRAHFQRRYCLFGRNRSWVSTGRKHY